MKQLFKNAYVYNIGKADIAVGNGVISQIASFISPQDGDVVFDLNNMHIFPGFADVHVHLREPGFSYKETIESGTRACAAGGFTHVCSMPNLKPVPDSKENLDKQLEIINRDAVINVYPFGSITKGQSGQELSDIEAMADDVIGFSDDGKGVQSADMMRMAMAKAKELGKIISAHCEDDSLLRGGYIHDGEYCAAHGHKGICSQSEWGPIARDIELLSQTGASYHICHISTKESVDIIRSAKAAGLDITCETAPHYLVFADSDLQDSGRFKMNPPIRSAADRGALIEGIIDGTVDMIATDHAPHSLEEKSGGLKDSLNGIVGIETSFPVMYTHFVRSGVISLDKLISLMSVNPAKRFGFDNSLDVGKRANFTVFDLDSSYTVCGDNFLSMGKCSPFEGMKVWGKCCLTVANGNIAYNNIIKE